MPPRFARKNGRLAHGLLSLAAFVLCLASPAFADELPAVSMKVPSWKVSERSDEYVIYKRRQAGSGFDAYRLEAEIDAPPAAVAEAARRNIVDPNLVHANMTKQILRTEGNVAWVYSYIDLPMVNDRDVITRAERSHDPEAGTYRLDWRTSDEGPTPQRGVVRLQHSSGSWVFSPLGNGRTRAIYENYTDIGGRIPAWIVNPMMNSTVTQGFTDLRDTVVDQQRSAAADSASLAQGHDTGRAAPPDSL